MVRFTCGVHRPNVCTHTHPFHHSSSLQVIDKNRSARQAKRIERSRASNKTRGMAAIQEDDHDDFEVDSEIIRATCVIHRELKESKSLSSLNSKSQSRIARSHTKQ